MDYQQLLANVAHSPQSLVRKLSVQPDSPFYVLIENELAHRFDYACCNSMNTFRREQRAITRNGQIKSGGERHEMDDRVRSATAPVTC